MTRIAIGIDPSLAHTGICRLYDGQESVVAEIPTPAGTHRPERLIALREMVREFLHQSVRDYLAPRPAEVPPGEVRASIPTPVVIALETEIWMGAGHTASESAAVQTIFQVLFWEMRVQWARAQWPVFRFLPVNVSQVKKWVDAREKQHVLMKVYKQYDREFTNDNEADAFVLAHIADAYACAQLSPVTVSGLPKRQQEVLKKLVCPWEAPLPPPTPVRKPRR